MITEQDLKDAVLKAKEIDGDIYIHPLSYMEVLDIINQQLEVTATQTNITPEEFGKYFVSPPIGAVDLKFDKAMEVGIIRAMPKPDLKNLFEIRGLF